MEGNNPHRHFTENIESCTTSPLKNATFSQGSIDYVPTSQGASYPNDLGQINSNLGFFSQGTPNYQHLRGNMIGGSQYSPGSHGFTSYQIGPGQMPQSQNDYIEPTLAGSSNLHTFHDLEYGSGIQISRPTLFHGTEPTAQSRYSPTDGHNVPNQTKSMSHDMTTTPTQQTAGGGLKRQEPSRTRVVSAPKRVKRSSIDQQVDGINPKVGDRNLQTTQPQYGAYSSTFNNPEQARNRLTQLQWTPPPDPSLALPVMPQEMLPYVIQVYDAMVDTHTGFYDKLNAANRILNGKYHAECVEATAWLIIDEAVALHRHGCRLLPTADPTYELKGTKIFLHENRVLVFKDRIQAICDTFRVFKSACCEALDGAKSFKIVYGPTKIRERTKNNAISNDRRAKKARLTSGGSVTNAGFTRGESEAIVDQSGAHVGAQAEEPSPPSFTSQNHDSFADHQHISPSKTNPSPPIKLEPLRTPRKPEPALFRGMHVYATPSEPLKHPLFYNYANYSVGQSEPLNAQAGNDNDQQITGSRSRMTGGNQNIDDPPTPTPAYRTPITEVEWLHSQQNDAQ